MAITTLIIGTIMFALGIWGQITLRARRKPTAQPGDRRSFRLVVTVLSIVIGAWLLILSAVYLLHGRHASLHT